MGGRQVIVTGSSPGSIGYETARDTCGLGCRGGGHLPSRRRVAQEKSLYRDLKGHGQDAGKVTVRRLDLTDAQSVTDFAGWYTGAHDGRLHVLINNAGVHEGVFNRKRVPAPSPDGFEVHWRTNYLGPFHLTSLLLPALQRGGRESGDARVLNVVSHLRETVTNESLFAPPARYDAWDAYGRSKLALAHFTFELQRRFSREHKRSGLCRGSGVGFHQPDPAGNTGRLAGGALAQSFPEARCTLSVAAGTRRPRHPSCARAGKPLQGGLYYERCGIGEAGATTADREVAARLWEQAERWVSSL